MIRKLRHKFIAIAMASMAFVLIFIIAAINIANYRNVNRSADKLLAILADNGGEFPDSVKEMPEPGDEFPSDAGSSSGKKKKPSDTDKEPPHLRKTSGISAEAAYNTRYFTVTLNEDGSVYTINTGKIHAISTKRAEEYATELYSSGKIKGFVGHYKYIRIQTGEDSNPYMYIFLDCEQSLTTFRNFLVASILISVAGLLVVFILVVIFSKIALRPVAESIAKQKRFITDASHEIKTPLTIIDANTEIIEMMGEENEWTQSIRNQIRRLTDLTQKMVFLSRMDEESTHLVMLDFSLSDAVLETAEPFLAVAETTDRRLILDIAPNITYHGDEANIRQMISLLVDNALKYSSKPGEIRVKLTSGNRIHLSVWNTVDEIEAGSQDILFDRFYRRDSSRSSKTGGSGIGLSVVQAIVLAHKGKITARSGDGKSIQFSITL